MAKGLHLRRAIGAAAAVVCAAAFAQAAAASELKTGEIKTGETKTYVLSWFHMATYSQEEDCPDGLNPKADVMFRRILKEMGKTPDEIEKLYKDFPYSLSPIITNRGRIDGKPTNVYITPSSWPDPHIKTAVGHVAYGFNLDGNESTGGFTDPETGEKGVDNQVYRALGCFETQRAPASQRPTYPYIQWDMTRDFMHAWLVEITGIHNPQNDDDVTVHLYRALEPVTRDIVGNVQPDMSFKLDPNPDTQTTVHGKIKDGLLVTDTFAFYETGDPLAIADYELHRARMRLKMNADGTIVGIVAGYQPWRTIYSSYALPGSTNETQLSVDTPGIYYALKRLADGDPDPKTGENTSISASYKMEGVSAFIEHAPASKVAQAR